MKRYLAILFFYMFCLLPVPAIDLDTSIDDEIRKNYKSDELVDEELPELPKILQTTKDSSIVDSEEVIKEKIAPATYRGVIKCISKKLL